MSADLYPKTSRLFNTWLRGLPAGTKFNAMDSKKCPCARFGRTMTKEKVRFAYPQYWLDGVEDNRTSRQRFDAPGWTHRVQTAAFETADYNCNCTAGALRKKLRLK